MVAIVIVVVISVVVISVVVIAVVVIAVVVISVTVFIVTFEVTVVITRGSATNRTRGRSIGQASRGQTAIGDAQRRGLDGRGKRRRTRC